MKSIEVVKRYKLKTRFECKKNNILKNNKEMIKVCKKGNEYLCELLLQANLLEQLKEQLIWDHKYDELCRWHTGNFYEEQSKRQSYFKFVSTMISSIKENKES
jgi:hypothetical protein